MLIDFLEQIVSGKVKLLFKGAFNVEAGDFEIANRIFRQCDDCSPSYDQSVSWACDTCGRAEDTQVIGLAGDGDGVYTVWTVWSTRHELGIGTIAFFDSGYSIANACMDIVQAGKWPVFENDILELLEPFAESKLVEKCAFDTSERVILGGKGFSLEHPAAVQIWYTGKERLSVNYFVEEPGNHTGLFANDTLHRPRAVLALIEEFKHFRGPQDIKARKIDWRKEDEEGLLSIQASHIEPVAENVAVLNFLANYNLRDEAEVMRVADDAFLEYASSWAIFHFLVNQDPRLLQLIHDEAWDFSDCEIDDLYKAVGLVNEDRVNSINEIYELAGLANGSASAKSKAPKFCSDCGTKLTSNAKFCSDCGTKIG